MKVRIMVLGIFLLSLMFVACSTIPKPVDSKYLVDITDEESVKVEALEADIVERHKAKIAADEDLKKNDPNPNELEGEIELLVQERDVLKDQYKLYGEKDDMNRMQQKKEQLQKTEVLLAKKRADFKYAQALRKFKEDTLELKSAELALSVAQLRYMKAGIARKYREKNEPVKVETSRFEVWDKLMGRDKNDPYGYKKYKAYLDKQKKAVLKAQKKQKKSEVDLKAAEKDLQNHGQEEGSNEYR